MTEEERKAEEERQRKLLQEQQSASLDGLSGFIKMIVDAIKGFFDFLSKAFSGKDVADGDGREVEQPGGKEELFNGIKASAASVKVWAEYQRDNKGKAVQHRSPIEGKATVGDDRHMREKHPIHGDRRMHHGVDFPASESTSRNIVASAEGIVVYSGTLSGYGKTVILGHADGSYSLYAHLTGEAMPESASKMQQGQKIGAMGASGGATGVHLHYEQRKGSESITPVIAGKEATRGVSLVASGALPSLAQVGVTGGDTSAPPAFARVASNQVAPVHRH